MLGHGLALRPSLSCVSMLIPTTDGRIGEVFVGEPTKRSTGLSPGTAYPNVLLIEPPPNRRFLRLEPPPKENHNDEP